MSYDLRVIPTLPRTFTWGELATKLAAHLKTPWIKELVGNTPGLTVSNVRLAVAASQPIEVQKEDINGCSFYAFEFAQPVTLSLWVHANRLDTGEEPLNRKLFIDDCGSNLDYLENDQVFEAWSRCGVYFEVSSYPGRHKHEMAFMKHIVIAIAELCDGYVVINNDYPSNIGTGFFHASDLADYVVPS